MGNDSSLEFKTSSLKNPCLSLSYAEDKDKCGLLKCIRTGSSKANALFQKHSSLDKNEVIYEGKCQLEIRNCVCLKNYVLNHMLATTCVEL